MTQASSTEAPGADGPHLCKIGGVAALSAGILFRRNLGVEVAPFLEPIPDTVDAWFALLQSRRLLGLVYLNLLDLVNYVLVGLMLLGLYGALRRANKNAMTLATALGFVGIAVYCASNTAFSMVALSDHYAAAATDARRATLRAAGEALLALNRFTSSGAHPGAGGYVSLALVAAASMIASAVMLRSEAFNRATAYVGMLASSLDLAYCIAFVLVPAIDSELLSVLFIPAAGLFWMIWHLMVGHRLCHTDL